MTFEIPERSNQWHGSALIAAVHRVVHLDKQDKVFKTRVAFFGLALLMGAMLGALVVNVPPLYLLLGLGGVVFAFLLLFKIEIAILLAILLRNWLGQFNYLAGDLPTHPNGLIGLALIVAGGAFFLLKRRDLSRLRAFWPFLTFAAIAVVSLLWTGKYLMDGLTVVLRLLTALAIYAVLVYKLDSTKKINLLVGVIIAAQVLPTAEGLVRVAQGGGMDLATAEIVRSGDSGQGAFLAMILAFCLVQFLDASSARRRLLWGIVTGFFAIGLFFSYGRAGWIGFAFTAIVIGLMKRSKLLIVFPVVLVLLITLVPTITERFSDIDIQSLDNSSSSTLAGRINVWQESAEVYATRPLLGVGYGVGRYRTGEYSAASAGALHNDYLGVLVETGLIGLMVFLLWHGQWFVDLLRVRRTSRHAYDRTLALAVFAMFFASLVVSITDNVLASTEKLYPLVALVAATVALPRIRAEQEDRVSARIRPEVAPVADMAPATYSETLYGQVQPAVAQQPQLLSAEMAMSAEILSTEGELVQSLKAPVFEQVGSDVLTVARGGSLAFVGSVVTRGLNYAYSAALVWGLGAGNFGLFTLALAITGFVGVIADLGMSQGIVRFGAVRAQTQGRAGVHKTTMAALRVVLPAGLLFLLALLVSADLIAGSVFGKPELAPLIRALGLSVPFMSLQAVFLSATRAVKIMKCTVVVHTTQAVAALGLAIPLLALHMGNQVVALSFVVSYVLGASLAFYYYLKVIYSKESSPERFPLKQMFKFSLPLSLTNWMHFANERTEIFFLGMLPGAVDVGIYKIAWSVAGFETLFTESLNQILAPFASDLSHRQRLRQLETLYKTTAKWSFAAALVLFLIFALFSETIMNVFDPAFVAGTGVLVALGFAQLINAGTGPCGTMLIMSGRSDLSLLNTIAMFVSSIALDWLLIPKYGLSGAALAGTLVIIAVNLLRVVEVWLTLRIHPFKWSFAKPILAGLVSLALVVGLRSFIHSETLALDVAYSLLLVVTYIAIIYLLKLDAEDMLVLDAVRRRIFGPKGA